MDQDGASQKTRQDERRDERIIAGVESETDSHTTLVGRRDRSQ